MGSNDWLLLMFRFDWSSASFQKQFKVKLLKNKDPIPKYLLGCFWRQILFNRLEDNRSVDLVEIEQYTQLLENVSEEFKFETEIKRDVHRTFPELVFFKERGSYGQAELFNVLKAFSIHNPEVGYCQGMGFIAGVLLSHMGELDAFNCLVILMNQEMGGFYKPGLPALAECLTQLNSVIEKELPALHAHFQQIGIEISMFGSQWILSLFIYNLSFNKSVALFNLFLVFGYRIIILFGIHLLGRMEHALLRMDFEGTLSHINNIDNVVSDMGEFVNWLEDQGGWEVVTDNPHKQRKILATST